MYKFILLFISAISLSYSNDNLLKENLAHFTFQTMKPSDIDECVNLIAQCFVEVEPLTQVLRISCEEFKPFARRVCEHGLGSSTLIKDTKTNSIVGCTIGVDSHSEIDFSTIKNLSPKFGPIIEILRQVSNVSLDHPYLHIYLAANDKKYAGEKVFTHSLSHYINFAKQKNFHAIICEAAGPASLKHGLRSGFKDYNHIEYETFDYKGDYPFQGISGGITLLVKTLNNSKL